MEKKINVAELLKDCPMGMELDCTMYDNLYFNCIREHPIYPITCWTVDSKGNRHDISFNWYGKSSSVDTAKCVIFPKGKTTWEGFQRPFKDGDICITILGTIFIYRSITTYNICGSYVSLDDKGVFYRHYNSFPKNCCSHATEEEKQKLFDAIKENGYKWNADEKTLEKLIEPKFKVGDIVSLKGGYEVGVINIVTKDFYELKVKDTLHYIAIANQKHYELVTNKFDITTLVPFESKVLVSSYGRWYPAIYGGYNKEYAKPFFTIGGLCWGKCIPYEGNEHLLGTTNDCSDYYKTWEE